MDIEREWNCFCNQGAKNTNSFDTLRCSICSKRSHTNCYEVYSIEGKSTFICIDCRIHLNDPFHEFEISLYPTLIIHQEQKVNKEFKFSLNADQVNQIRNGKRSVVMAFTRLIYEDPKYIDFPDEKASVLIKCNDKQVTYLKRTLVNLDNFVVEGKNRVDLFIAPLTFKCLVSIFYARTIDHKQVAKKILAFEGQPSLDQAQRNFETIRLKDLEVLTVFPLRDPITNKILKFPARGQKCTHIQCFDMLNFLKFYQKPTEKYWKCFCCKNIVPWKDLRIDQYMFNTLKEISEKYGDLEDANTICYDEKGGWKLQEEFSKEWNQTFVENRPKERVKPKSTAMEEEKANIENIPVVDEQKPNRQPGPYIRKTELSIEENIESYNTIQQQMKMLHDSDKISEATAKQMKVLNSFKNYSANKLYAFFEKSMIGLALHSPSIFTEYDEKNLFLPPDQLAEKIFHKRVGSIIPFIFSWAKSYDDLIKIILVVITKDKLTEPDFALCLEILLCLSWYMENKKIGFEGIAIRQNQYQLLGILIYQLGMKLNWEIKQFAMIMAIFRKYFPTLYIPTTIPKRFGAETEALFNKQADLLSNILKGRSLEEINVFFDLIYKPPKEEIPNEEKIFLRYFYYLFIVTLKKINSTYTETEIQEAFISWDKFKKGMEVLNDANITPWNIKDFLQNNEQVILYFIWFKVFQISNPHQKIPIFYQTLKREMISFKGQGRDYGLKNTKKIAKIVHNQLL